MYKYRVVYLDRDGLRKEVSFRADGVGQALLGFHKSTLPCGEVMSVIREGK